MTATGSTVPIIYTALAGVSTLSSFTTLVKNKMDLTPGLSRDAAISAIKTDAGLTADIFDATAYDDSVNALNTKIADIAQQTAEYIVDELGNIPLNSSIVALLYNSINSALSAIKSDSTSVDDAVSNIKSAIGNVADAINAINAALDSRWDLTQPVQLYLTDSDHSISNMRFTGSAMLLGDERSISGLKGQPLPPPGNRYSVTFSRNEKGELGWRLEPDGERINLVSISASFRTDLESQSLTANGGKTIPFSEGAYSYTIMKYDALSPIPSNTPDPIAYIKNNFSSVWRYSSDWTDRVLQDIYLPNENLNNGQIINLGYSGGKITIASGNAFSWAQEGDCMDYLFSSCYVAPKNGTYTRSGSGNHDTEYTFTANDGTVWYLFYAISGMVADISDDGDPLHEGWYIYQLFHDSVEWKFFNDIAARNIIDQW